MIIKFSDGRLGTVIGRKVDRNQNAYLIVREPNKPELVAHRLSGDATKKMDSPFKKRIYFGFPTDGLVIKW